jgi:hypothetical protein
VANVGSSYEGKSSKIVASQVIITNASSCGIRARSSPCNNEMNSGKDMQEPCLQFYNSDKDREYEGPGMAQLSRNCNYFGSGDYCSCKHCCCY